MPRYSTDSRLDAHSFRDDDTTICERDRRPDHTIRAHTYTQWYDMLVHWNSCYERLCFLNTTAAYPFSINAMKIQLGHVPSSDTRNRWRHRQIGALEKALQEQEQTVRAYSGLRTNGAMRADNPYLVTDMDMGDLTAIKERRARDKANKAKGQAPEAHTHFFKQDHANPTSNLTSTRKKAIQDAKEKAAKAANKTLAVHAPAPSLQCRWRH